MVEGILQALHEVEGVQASLVVGAEAQILAHRAHAVYDLGLLSQVGRLILTAIDSVQLVHDDWETLTASFAEGKLLMRNLGASSAGRPLILAVVADARLNPSFAGVAIRVAATRLKTAFPFEVPARRPEAFSSTSFANSVPTPPPLLTPAALLTPAPLPAAEDPASAAFVVACTRALAGSVGPMAKVFVKETVRRLCGAQPFTPDQAQVLVTALERHIEDPAERAQFRKTLANP